MKIIRIVGLMAMLSVSVMSLSAQESLYRKYLCKEDLLGGKTTGLEYYLEVLWVDNEISEVILTGVGDQSYERFWLKEQVGGDKKNCEEYIMHNVQGVFYYVRFCKPADAKPTLYLTRVEFRDGRWHGHTDDISRGWLFKNLTRVLE